MLHISLEGVETIKNIQDTFKDNYKIKSTLQELIQNSLNENQKAEIYIADKLILLRILLSNEQEVYEVEEQIKKGIKQAQECLNNKEKRLQSLSESSRSVRQHGRGFLSVLHHGWALYTLPNHKEVLIAAVAASNLK